MQQRTVCASTTMNKFSTCCAAHRELERQKGALYGLVLVVLGIASGAMSKTTGGTDVQNFISGVLMGLSVAEILAGIWVAGKTFLKQ